MSSSLEERQLQGAAGRVRSNAGSAGFSALCMIYFGYFFFRLPVAKDLFALGDAAFQYTLRIGGVAMALIAAASLTGHYRILGFDAVLSIVIGVSMLVSDLLMIAGAGTAGLNQFFYLLFGGMFVTAGLRNGRDYLALRSIARSVDQSAEPMGECDDPPTPTAIPTPVQVAAIGAPRARVPLPPAEGFLAGFAKKKPPAGRP